MDTIQNNNADIGSSQNIFESSTPVSSSTGDNGGILGALFSISFTTWIIIIVILAFLGFNIFVYLAKGTQEFTDVFKPLVTSIAKLFAGITGQIVNTSATGAKAVVNTTADVLDAGLTKVQNITDTQGKKAESSVGGTNLQNAIPQADIMHNNTVNKSLNKSTNEKIIGSTHEFTADDSTSSIQKPQTKGGYCYIGEERGHRSCMRVNEEDKCMSGEIFPTRDICVNPNLRV